MFIQLFTKLVPFVLHMNIFNLQRITDDAAGYTFSVGFFKLPAYSIFFCRSFNLFSAYSIFFWCMVYIVGYRIKLNVFICLLFCKKKPASRKLLLRSAIRQEIQYVSSVFWCMVNGHAKVYVYRFIYNLLRQSL
jgi:hypothetical protein